MGYYGRGAGNIQILRNKKGQLVGINMEGGHHAEQEYFDDETIDLKGKTIDETIVKDSKDICMVKTKDGNVIVFSGSSKREYTSEEIEGIVNDIYSNKKDDREIAENLGLPDVNILKKMEKEINIRESDKTQEEKDILIKDLKSIYGTWEKDGRFAMISENEQGIQDLTELYENIEMGNVSISTNPYVNDKNYEDPRSIAFSIVDRIKEMNKDGHEIDNNKISSYKEINEVEKNSKGLEELDKKFEENGIQRGDIFSFEDSSKKGNYVIDEYVRNDGYKDVFKFYSLDGKDRTSGYLSYFERTGESISPEEVDNIKAQFEKYEEEEYQKYKSENEDIAKDSQSQEDMKALNEVASRHTLNAINEKSNLLKSKIKEFINKFKNKNKDEKDIDIK